MFSHDELEEVLNVQLFPFVTKTLNHSLTHFLDTLSYSQPSQKDNYWESSKK